MKYLVLVTLFLIDAAYSKSLKERAAEDSEAAHQCEYNGQTFQEGDALPTRRLCLDCKCTKNFTEANDRECDVIQCPATNHAELGCMPVYDNNDCCPVKWDCEKSVTASKCDKRYFKHYIVKGCTPIYKEGSDCPLRFECRGIAADENKKKCEFHGRLYEEGEDIPTDNPCQICSCRTNWKVEGAVEMNCISIECPSIFRQRLNDSCYDVYESDKCCSVGTDCSPNEPTAETETVCLYGDKTYRLGQKIYPKEDPCLTCTCTPQWAGIYGNSCRVHDCLLETKMSQLQDGCVPIYHEATCCPIEFYCGSSEEGFENTTVPVANSADIESKNTCMFRGVHYKLGQILEINHPTNCVTCTCTTPPDFTCIHKSCPNPPNNDYENCHPTFVPGACCPTYDCKQSLQWNKLPQCSPVHCPAGCTEVTIHNSCPFCKCQDRICAPPKCDDGCEVQTDVLSGECPNCHCPGKDKVEPTCSNVTCTDHCLEVTDMHGCPLCVCGPLCTPPKCGPGCILLRDVPEGECPRCSCSDPGTEILNVQCSPVKCAIDCIEAIGSNGCPTCVCNPQCSTPNCGTGCEVRYDSLVDSCPICACENSFPDVHCSMPNCEPNCTIDYNVKPCATCKCGEDDNVMCSPPKCTDPGCTINYDAEPCPSCECGGVTVVQPVLRCLRPKCAPGCHVNYNMNPCPSCQCPRPSYRPRVRCMPPKCAEGCHVDYSKKPCPTCDCSLDFRIHCTLPRCEEGCHTDYNTKPCPSCSCSDGSSELTGVECSLPKCDEPGCHIDYDADPCPDCVCNGSSTGLPKVMCSPPKCDEPGCHINNDADPCPDCVCDLKTSADTPVHLFYDPYCATQTCGPGCEQSMAPLTENDRCPMCTCHGPAGKNLTCIPMQCQLPCRWKRFTEHGCPTCICFNYGGPSMF